MDSRQPPMTRVLLIEDDKLAQTAFKEFVEEEDLNYDYTIASSITETKELLQKNNYDVVITDYFLKDGSSFNIFDIILQTAPLIITTDADNVELAVRAMKFGAYDYIIKDEDAHYLKILPVTVRNAISRKKTENQYRMLSQAVMTISDSIFITDMSDIILFVNEAFSHTYGYQKDEILGQSSKILWKSPDNARSAQPGTDQDDEILISGKREYYHIRKDGTEFPIFLSRSGIKNERGDEVAVISVARDITERVKLQQELIKNTRLETITQIAITTNHEINNPLAAISGYAELILNSSDRLDPVFSKYAEGIIDNVFRIKSVTHKLESIIEPAVTDYLPVALKMIDLKSSTAGRIPKVLVVDDEDSVRFILANIVDHAGYEVQEASTGEEALHHLEEETFNLVITDMKMPGMGGKKLVELLSSTKPEVPVVIITGFEEKEALQLTKRQKAVGFVRKPFRQKEIQGVLERVLHPT